MKDSSKSWQRIREPNNKIPFTFVLPLVALVALAVAVMISESIASWLQQLLGLEGEKYKVLKAIGFCVAGVVSIWLAWVANKRTKAMEDSARNAVEEQREKRLKNAIEHLGHKSESVRISGAYELFHLAKDTEKLRQTVLDILCVHIRQTTTGQTATDQTAKDQTAKDQTAKDQTTTDQTAKGQTTHEKNYQAKHEKKPSEEIQSLLTLLFVQKHDHDVFKNYSINLQASYLNGADLSKARLQGANLKEAQLQGADLSEAQLQEAVLREAQLQGADRSKEKLQKTDLSKAQLKGANLKEAQLREADLSKAQLQGANLKKAQLQGADLSEAQLQGTNLRKAQLREANLSKAQLQGADLMDAQLQGADLKEAQLQGVSSQKTDSLSSSAGFESKIRGRIGEPSDLKGISFASGLQEEDLDTLGGGRFNKVVQALRKTLRAHFRQPVSHKLPRGSGAKTGAYTQEEAKQWIAEYNKAMEGAPR